ncbi:LysR family transcriptional regulator [Clostridium sp. chh4-2]|uniref:LysR family transcriptional regulator n=1 Tax=Clostridium sp. chh4-2 TaxID=2067550 RepID=UPI000CCDD43C|nr:LysR family transcriptional regulator [Clostridium sp. chh4-2]PNV63737.1 LysR family transcriptional regulator [Clostridium sp. chh4-2]
MELRELNYILTLAKHGKVSAAASELYMAQSSLSQFLKNHEEKLGFSIFIRTNRGLIPTEEGKLYIETVKQILNLQRNFYSQLSDLENLKRGNVNFALSPFRAPYLLPKVIPAFTRLYPNIKLTIHESGMKEQEELLSQSLIDLGFVTIPMTNPSLPYRHAIEEEILLAVPKDFPLCKKAHPAGSTGRPWIEIKDISHQKLLLYSVNHKLRVFVESLFQEYHLEPDIVQTHNSFETLIRLANVGMGITFLPECYLEPLDGLRHFSLGEQGRYRSLALGYPASGYVSKATNAFSEIVIQELKKQQEAAKGIL